MKKEKTVIRQSEGKGAGEKKSGNEKAKRDSGPKVLVPLLSKREAEPNFINAVADRAGEVILLLVIDTNAMAGRFGFATGEIGMGNALMQKLRAELGKKKKHCDDILEWGDTASKIEHIAQLYNAKNICLVKQGNDYYRKLVADMKEKLPGVEITEIELAPEPK